MKSAFLLFVLLWSFWVVINGYAFEEIVTGFIVSLILAAVFAGFFIQKAGKSYAKRFVYILAYIPYYMWQEVLCVSDVTKRIITGRINPAIVEVAHPHKSEWGITMLANSITMTPGTLALEARPGKVYVHWLNASGDKKQIAGVFDKLLMKIWD
ncbi:MAG: Na+/H+ antiporter subunit E [Candidatus Aenigmatarchaeota archaeon]